jgi:hypothetical protein
MPADSVYLTLRSARIYFSPGHHELDFSKQKPVITLSVLVQNVKRRKALYVP